MDYVTNVLVAAHDFAPQHVIQLNFHVGGACIVPTLNYCILRSIFSKTTTSHHDSAPSTLFRRHRHSSAAEMSFFKAPTWAKSQSKNDDDEEEQTERDLFSHSKNFMAIQRDRLEQEKRRKERSKQKEREREQNRKEKLAKKESKAAIKRESPGADSSAEPVKKRRITSEESVKLLKSVGVRPINIDSDDEDEQIRYDVAEILPTRRSPRTRHTRDALGHERARSNLSNISKTGGGLDTASKAEIAKVAMEQPAEPEEDEDSDEEIAALQRIAREKHQRRKQLEEAQKALLPSAVGSDANPGLPTTPPPDPVISLFITSEIPNTKPLLVRRKLTQDLGEPRRAWCKKSGFTDEFSDKVFFTWCGRRMYDVTTCQRLGLEVDAAGNIVRADERDEDGAAQVHVIATTQELLDQEKAEQVRQAKLDSAVYEPDEQATADEEEDTARKEVKIIVKAKDADAVPVKVFSVSES